MCREQIGSEVFAARRGGIVIGNEAVGGRACVKGETAFGPVAGSSERGNEEAGTSR